MSGVTHGSRLDQLEQLRDRIDQEINAERARLHLEPRPADPAAPVERDYYGLSPAQRLMRELHVTPATVRAWALRNNVPCGDRGRLPLTLVETYAHHRQEFVQ